MLHELEFVPQPIFDHVVALHEHFELLYSLLEPELPQLLL